MTLLTVPTATNPVIEAAKQLIRPYVKRGDPIEWLHDMGSGSPQSYSVSIGGYLAGKKYGNDKILVHRDMNGVVVDEVFKLKEIYNQVKGE